MKKTALLIVALAFGTGCFKHTFQVGSGGNVEAAPNYSRWHSHWLYGLIGNDTVDIKNICPSGNATVKDSHSFLNMLVAMFIGIVWYPTEVEVFCDNAKVTTLTVTPDQVSALVLDPEFRAWAASEQPALAQQLDRAIAAGACQGEVVAVNQSAVSH